MIGLLAHSFQAVGVAASAAQSIAQGAVVGDDPSPLRTMAVAALAIRYAQKWMKTRPWYNKFVAAFPGADKRAHQLIAGLGSMVAAAGAHYTFTGSVLSGGTFIAQLPPLMQILSNLAHASVDVGGIFGLQQFMYEASRDAQYSPPPIPRLDRLDTL